MKLYLAHPFTMRKEIREWELFFEKYTGVELLNPFYDVENDDMAKFDEGLAEPRTIETREDGNEIMERDLHSIYWCQGLVGILEYGKESFGTPMEVFYNSHILQRPTYIITKSAIGHPWVKALATMTFKNPYEFAIFSGKR